MSDDRGATGQEGFEAAAEHESGHPLVVHGLNAILSTVFALTIVGGLNYVGSMAFTPVNVATVAVVIFTAAYLMTLR
ncbi:hypothetical protein [Halolamina salifodinae]|uniref:DUF8107 domain-containing protein n=1 Tax=Halolamina salifodinae TaxID=1202767 RepID=A0A8T4GXI6_9EURY|nr:hypothetical protein [Halolamina salifodinae]MBP1986803.1 hypothetical protein [Halolamina salifodinae]